MTSPFYCRTLLYSTPPSSSLPIQIKSVQPALSDLKRPPERLQFLSIIGLSLLNSILMACFLKQSFAQTCLKETNNGKLQQFTYASINLTGYHPPGLTAGPLIFSAKIPTRGTVFQCKTPANGSEKTKQNPHPGHHLPSSNAKISMK